MITIGIDGSNISSGGGLTHLVQLLAAAQPAASGVGHVHIWTSSKTAQKLPQRAWLSVHTPDWCNGRLARRIFGQQVQLGKMALGAGCDVLFAPGGTLPMVCPLPSVTMSQNMLPFEPSRAALFGRFSWMRLKMRLLRHSQGRSFRRAHGVIFLTQYARQAITQALGNLAGAVTVVPHGIEARFNQAPRPQRSAADFADSPLRLLYVSVQMPYKHHLQLIEAVAKLRGQGLPVVLHMVGGTAGAYGDAVRRRRLQLDPGQQFLHDLGHVDFAGLHDLYRAADMFVFASSCENLPNIMIEAMAAGLPIAASNCGPMPEVLGDAGVYFEPESVDSIADAISGLAKDAQLRAHLAQKAWQKTQVYSWERCAKDTLDFAATVALQSK